LSPCINESIRILKPGGFVAVWQAAAYLKYAWKWFGNDIHIYAGCKNFVQLRKTSINYAFDPIIPFLQRRSVSSKTGTAET